MADAQKTVQDVTAAVEDAWNTVRRAARSVSLLYAQGAATCQDVKTYNLLALSVYESQKAMLEFFRGQGITGLPALPPTPTLFSWKGTAGKDTVLLDCTTQLSGLAAAAPVPPGSLTVTTSEPDYMNPQIATFDFQKQQQKGLGVALVIYLVIAGIGFAAGLTAVLAFAAALESRSEQKRMMFEIGAKSKTALGLWDARNRCMTSCTTKDSNEVCFDKCLKLIPQVDVSATPPNKWNLWALIGLGAVGAVVGVALYLKIKGSGHGIAGYFGGSEEDEDDDGDEDDEPEDNGVDVLSGPSLATWRAKAA